LFVSQVTDQHGPHGSCNKSFLPLSFSFPHRRSIRLKQYKPGAEKQRGIGLGGGGSLRLASCWRRLAVSVRLGWCTTTSSSSPASPALARRGSSKSHEVLVRCFFPRRACMISEMKSQL
jgi:hypothetical protein